MPTGVNKSFLEFHQLLPDDVISILDRAGFLANAWADRRTPQSLQGKRVALIADDSGWRNTTAFNLGVKAMGGICVASPIAFNGRETTADLAGYLDNWFDLLVVRTRELSALRALSTHANAPVINARTKSNHPCETLGDLAYIYHRRGKVDGLKVVGVAPDANIFRSWVEASITMPIKVTQVYPEQWHVREPSLLNPNFKVSTDMNELLDADVIVTDSWPNGAQETVLAEYRISASILEKVRPDAIFLPCPPVERGQEVADDAMTHSACQSRFAKAFLLHAQNALIEWIIV